MYKFYAVQRWSSYAYSAINLMVGGIYLIMLLAKWSFCRSNFFSVCVVTTILCKYSKDTTSLMSMAMITSIMLVSLVQ